MSIEKMIQDIKAKESKDQVYESFAKAAFAKLSEKMEEKKKAIAGKLFNKPKQEE
ncbi:MAG TPA: hypothetical protein VFM18_05750 [Methanosarcina sp.]|nr:hypothetical protein [Methanosarcina sp.]